VAKPDVSVQQLGWQPPLRRKYSAESRISRDLLEDKGYFPDLNFADPKSCAEAFGRLHWGNDFIAVGRAEWVKVPYDPKPMLFANFAFWKEEKGAEDQRLHGN